MRPDHHAVAAAFVGRFHDELLEVFENVFTVGVHGGEVGVDIREDRFLAEIETDHRGDIVVGDLVVGDAGAEGVGEVHIPLAVGVDDARHAEHGVLAKDCRVEEIVINPAVDHIDLLEAFRGLHENPRVLNDEILAGDDLDAHCAGEERMFEISGVVDAWREHNDGRVWISSRRDIAKRGEEFLGVAVHRPNSVAAEKFWENPLHRLAVFEDIRNARRTPAVILEHKILAVRSAHEIGAANVNVYSMWDIQADEFGAVVFRGADDFERNDAFLHDALIVVDIVKEKIQCAQALLQSAFQMSPLVRRDDARHEVERHNPLGAFVTAIDREGDSLVQISTLRHRALALESGGVHIRETPEEPLVVWTDLAIRLEHLIEKSLRFVLIEKALHLPDVLPNGRAVKREKSRAASASSNLQRIQRTGDLMAAEFRINKSRRGGVRSRHTAHFCETLRAEKIQRGRQQRAA